eukprot:g81565.t1
MLKTSMYGPNTGMKTTPDPQFMKETGVNEAEFSIGWRNRESYNDFVESKSLLILQVTSFKPHAIKS